MWIIIMFCGLKWYRSKLTFLFGSFFQSDCNKG